MRRMNLQGIFWTAALVVGFALEPGLLWGQSKIFHSYSSPPSMPIFSLEDLQGKTVSGQDLLGRVLLLNFWATW